MDIHIYIVIYIGPILRENQNCWIVVNTMQELSTEEEDGDFSPDKSCVVCGRGIRDTRDTVTSPRDTSHVTPSIAADPRRRPTLSQQTTA